MRQLSFEFIKDYKKEFGGSLLSGKRKTKRPLTTKEPIHLILKSAHSVFIPGYFSLEKILRKTAQEFGIRLYDLALNWNHLHCVIRLKNQKDYNKFIRVLTARMAAEIRKRKPHLKEVFSLRPYTRILSWGRDFKNALQYQIINKMEARGLYPRTKKDPRRPPPA